MPTSFGENQKLEAESGYGFQILYWQFTKSCNILNGTTECFVIIYLPFSLNCKTREDCCRSFFAELFVSKLECWVK